MEFLKQTHCNDGNKFETSEHSVILKPLPLPTFHGKHSKWLSFFNLFGTFNLKLTIVAVIGQKEVEVSQDKVSTLCNLL